MNNKTGALLLLSDNRGTYIPQHFAQEFVLEKFGIAEDDDDIAILLEGRDHEHYWEAWDAVLEKAKTYDGGTLHQDGDLWLVRPYLMTNEEYENFFGEMKPAPDGWFEYEVCRDCLLYVAYAELPEDSPDWTTDGVDVLSDPVADGAEYGFTHAECDCCNALAGARYRLLCSA